MKMEIVTQLSVFLENRPGTLATVCEELARAKVNIHAMTISDATDYAVVRLVLSNTRKAIFLFEERGVLAIESDVLLIEGENRPGGLAVLANKLAKAKINIEYAYLATPTTSKKGLLILKTSNVQKALQTLTR